MSLAVEHMYNSRGEVAVALAPLHSAPIEWSVDDEGRIWLVSPGSLDRQIEISPDCVRLAVDAKRLLVVEVSQDPEGDVEMRQTWTPFRAD